MNIFFKNIGLIVLAAVILGTGYYYLTQEGSLQTSVLFQQTGTTGQTGTPATPSPTGAPSADVLVKLFSTETVQGEPIFLGVELENPSATDTTTVYGASFDIVYPPTGRVRLDSQALVQTYNTLLVEAHRIDTGTGTIYYRGYSGTGGNPLFLSPGERKVLFTTEFWPSVDQTGAAYTETFTVQTAQVIIDPPVIPAAAVSTPTFAIDLSNIDLPITFYPYANPDVNFDGKVDNQDVQYLFDFWNP